MGIRSHKRVWQRFPDWLDGVGLLVACYRVEEVINLSFVKHLTTHSWNPWIPIPLHRHTHTHTYTHMHTHTCTHPCISIPWTEKYMDRRTDPRTLKQGSVRTDLAEARGGGGVGGWGLGRSSEDDILVRDLRMEAINSLKSTQSLSPPMEVIAKLGRSKLGTGFRVQFKTDCYLRLLLTDPDTQGNLLSHRPGWWGATFHSHLMGLKML